MKPEHSHGEAGRAHREPHQRHHAEGRASIDPKTDSDPVAVSQGEARDEDDQTLSRLQTENADLKDRLLRALADAENVRRRAERDVNEARQFAITGFARDMVDVADNLERALASVPNGEHDGNSTLSTLTQGVDLTRKEMLRALEKHGVRKLDPAGQRFDPNFHEAMFEVPGTPEQAGTVTQVVSPGFAIGARVLRPAKVGVAGEHKVPAS